jgi:hypothetical protein
MTPRRSQPPSLRMICRQSRYSSARSSEPGESAHHLHMCPRLLLGDLPLGNLRPYELKVYLIGVCAMFLSWCSALCLATDVTRALLMRRPWKGVGSQWHRTTSRTADADWRSMRDAAAPCSAALTLPGPRFSLPPYKRKSAGYHRGWCEAQVPLRDDDVRHHWWRVHCCRNIGRPCAHRRALCQEG